ncbi:hypothetical protein V1525DRAFT_418724 [Lipomyces kononenkoae]|uniref:Uncharacterized protein n=1 Tax=Lipomyces kononenkoae TaxID=34357 RepID=A0ACC3T3U0_LIPKO
MGRRSKRSIRGEANAKKLARKNAYEEPDKLSVEVACETTPDEIEIELDIESDCVFEELKVRHEDLDNIQSLNNNMADTPPTNALLRFSEDAANHLTRGSRPGNSRTSQYRRYRQGKDTTGMKSLFEYFKPPNNDNLEAVARPKRSPKEMISEILVHLREPNTESHEE